MRAHTERLYRWTLKKAESSRAPYWLALVFALEIFLFIPLDPILIFCILQNRKNAWTYALIAALASCCSAALGYLVGHFLWDLASPYLIPQWISATTFDRIVSHVEHYEGWAIWLGAALPFPLKVLSLGAGVLQIGLTPFLLYFLLARLSRFCSIALSLWIWGDKVKTFLDRHFHRVFLLLGAKMALALGCIWFFAYLE